MPEAKGKGAVKKPAPAKRKAAPTKAAPKPKKEVAKATSASPSDGKTRPAKTTLLKAPAEAPRSHGIAPAAPPPPTWHSAAPRPKAAPRPFDAATGDWIPVEPAGRPSPSPPLAAPFGSSPLPDYSGAALDPAAPRKGALYTIMWVLLALDLAALAFLIVSSLMAGAILAFQPDSAQAEELLRQYEDTSRSDVALNSLLTFMLFGLIPFAWVLGTRVKPWAGTRKFLHLDGRWKDLGKAILLTIPILIGVTLLIVVYVLATEGPDGLTTEPEDESQNPAVDSVVANITLPLALLVSLCAGIGEEVLFRGILQKRLGIWGQAALFGLAHAGGGYIPQIVFAAALGVLFGYLLKRGWPLWALMVTHFLYDFVLLSSVLYFPEYG